VTRGITRVPGKFAARYAEGVRFYPLRKRGNLYLTLDPINDLEGYGEVVLFRRGLVLLLLELRWGPNPEGPWERHHYPFKIFPGWSSMKRTEKTIWDRLGGKNLV
jgi:hypothetical protein